MANKWVYMFSEGDMTMRNLLGGKGANLAERHPADRARHKRLYCPGQSRLPPVPHRTT